jgi:hypothetical protein
MEGITLVESEQIEKKLQIILRQTEYSNEKALEKLKQFNFDEMSVIKDYFGITKKNALPIKSVNQEIYKQLRGHLDGAMKDYRDRVDKGDVKKIV